MRLTKPRETLRKTVVIKIAGWLLVLFALLIVLGFVSFRSAGTMVSGNEMNVDRAIFTSINAATLTGFRLSTPIESFKFPAHVTILVMTIVGSLCSMIIGGLAVARLLGMRHSARRIMTAAIIAEALAVGVGATSLTGIDRPLLPAMILAASAFGNSGMTVSHPGGIFDIATHLVLLPLALLGGFGLPVLIELFDWMGERRPLSHYSRVVLMMSAGVYLMGLAALLAVRWPAVPPDQSMIAALRAPLAGSSVAAINSRTAGLQLDDLNTWGRAANWIAIVLMFIGASSAGTGGGLKITTLYTLGRGARAALGGQVPGRMLGFALVWLGIYMALIATTVTLLLCTQPALSADRCLFVAVSAAANVGLSHDPISLTSSGLHVLGGAMLLGRIGSWSILWWAALTTREADMAVG